MIKKRYAKTMKLLRLMMLFFVFAPLSLLAQNNAISGVVTDNNNEPVVGATVIVKNTTTGVITNIDGEYTINAPSNATLVFKYVGLAPREEKVNGRNKIDIAMTIDESVLNEVVVVGYGTQKKATLTGSVAGVRGSEMLHTKNENPQNMLAGRIAGVRVWQKSAEPGSYNNNFDIRAMGAPLVVIDGIMRSVEDFQRLNPNDIEDVSVLKDASAAIYGVRAANGVVLVTTKTGSKDGKTKVTYNGSFTLQQMTEMPELANAYDAMTLYNERSMNNVKATGGIIYDESWFESFRNGTRRETDWNSLIFSDVAPQTQQDLSISGGTNKTQYYISLGYFSQDGLFKSGDLNYKKYNLRSNINTEILNGLTFGLNLSAMADERNNPYSSAVDIIKNYWKQGVLSPAYADPENTMLNYEGLDMQQNTVAMMTADVSGYRKYLQKSFQSSATLNYDFGTILSALKGLSAKAVFSFDYRMDNNTMNRKEYYQYAYDKDKDVYNQRLYSQSSPNQVRREMFDKQQQLAQLLLNYNRTFGDHTLSGLVGWEGRLNKGDNFYAQRELPFASEYLFVGGDTNKDGGMAKGNSDLYEYNSSAIIGRANYAYGNRYLLEAQFRYDGSSRFAEGHQWGFFPSISAGWRISEEPFFKSVSALSFVNQLKLRASYGVVGDDLDSGWNYEWASGYNYPANGGGDVNNGYYNGYAPGYMFGNKFVYAMSPKPIPNEIISWFESHTFDIGVDFEGWNGLFGFVVDYFDRRREGLFARNTAEFPTVIGATAPNENLNSDRHFGIDLELTHRNKINDFSYKVKAIGTIARNEYLRAVQNGPYGNSYDQWRNDNLNNRYQGVQFGYEADGRFQNWKDIWYYPLYTENSTLPGDYKYQDWNGDGEISGLDEHPFAYDQTPWLNYSLSFDGSYKSFDLSFLLQGSALGSMEYKEPLYNIWGSNGGGTLTQYLDRWHPIDPLADPYNTSTQWVSGYYGYTGHYPKGNSEFNRVSTAYLRLKSIEVGYTLPKVKALSSMNLRVFANAYNLLTFTKVNFVDPEHPDTDEGRLYPLNKTYTLGLSLSF